MFRKGNHTFTEKNVTDFIGCWQVELAKRSHPVPAFIGYNPVGPGQVAHLACRLWPRTFVPCRSAGRRDNDTEVRRRGEHQPSSRSPVH